MAIVGIEPTSSARGRLPPNRDCLVIYMTTTAQEGVS